jgi:hypothetical protein
MRRRGALDAAGTRACITASVRARLATGRSSIRSGASAASSFGVGYFLVERLSFEASFRVLGYRRKACLGLVVCGAAWSNRPLVDAAESRRLFPARCEATVKRDYVCIGW